MKIYADIEQGGDEWHKLRLGIPTASCFDKIVTPKQCRLSKSASQYALKLCAERLLNMPTDSVEGVEWMDRGKEMEPIAVTQYEFTQDAKTLKVGFITTDDGSLGCSPDRLVLSDRRIGLEIKCPSPHVHLGYALNGVVDEYKPQVMGQMYVAELERADFYSFHPRMPPVLIQTARDEAYIGKLADALEAFREMLANTMDRAKALGVYQALSKAKSPMEIYEAQAMSGAFDVETFDAFVKHGYTN